MSSSERAGGITRLLGDGSPTISEAELAKWKKEDLFSIGHTRYTTKGSSEDKSQSQPIVSDDQAVALVHNGQVRCTSRWGSDTKFLTSELSDALCRHGYIPPMSRSYSCESINKPKSKPSSATTTSISKLSDEQKARMITCALHDIFQTLDGSFACVALIRGLGMVAFRDPKGIRPLVAIHDMAYHRRAAFASESCALPKWPGTVPMDLGAGCAMWLPLGGKEVHFLYPNGGSQAIERPLTFEPSSRSPPSPCLFEYIYLASEESIIDGIPVLAARERMGLLLIEQLKQLDIKIDTIVPVPHTPVRSGRVLADAIGADFVELLEVVTRCTRKEARTFILPTQQARALAVQSKFRVRPELVARCKGKCVMLLDDSIVRGTTLGFLCDYVRGSIHPAKLVVGSLAPPIVSSNRYGIDIPNTKQLVAAGYDCEDDIGPGVAKKVRADLVVYQKLESLQKGLCSLGGTPKAFEDSVFRLKSQTEAESSPKSDTDGETSPTTSETAMDVDGGGKRLDGSQRARRRIMHTGVLPGYTLQEYRVVCNLCKVTFNASTSNPNYVCDMCQHKQETSHLKFINKSLLGATMGLTVAIVGFVWRLYASGVSM
eukprot:gb/GEZN01003161.1/.p1 GENE.gb/GEZN01003161.1/~~gb/GEZN01003161.1/.p1  ORF type:complete len:666 (-),score=71.99 gb/GEZN01003161.1/:262-2064(-)